MGILKKGNNTSVGRVGNTVIYPLNGQLVERSIGISNKTPTMAQQAHRQRLKIINSFMGPIEGFITFGLALEGKKLGQNAHNVMTSYCYRHSLKGEFPHQEIDFSRVMLARGDMPVPDGLTVSGLDYQLEFSWDPQLLGDDTRWSDHAMLMAYCPEKKNAHYLIHGPVRRLGSATLDVPRYRNPVSYQIYIAFIADDHKKISDSTYLGSLLL